jgi:hypothetical protein
MIRFLAPMLMILVPELALGEEPKTYTVEQYGLMLQKEEDRIAEAVKKANGNLDKEKRIYDEEQRKLDKKWSGRKVRISGKAGELNAPPGPNPNNQTTGLTVEGEDSKVWCYLSAENKRNSKRLKELVREQEVVVEGKMARAPGGNRGYCVLKECVFITIKTPKPKEKAPNK